MKWVLASVNKIHCHSLFSLSSFADNISKSLRFSSQSSFLQWAHHALVAFDIATVQEWPQAQVNATDLHLEPREANPLNELANS